MRKPAAPARNRRSLSHVGGEVTLRAKDAAQGEALGHALSVDGEAAAEAARAHVHGFHSYPARMHPVTARRLVDAFSHVGDTVFDPFCGSGTVLVEALLAGRHARGVDANPLAVLLATCKTTKTTAASRAAFLGAVKRVTAAAEARRAARAGATRRYGPRDVALFEPHTLLELDGLRAAIASTPPGSTRDALFLTFSSILVKVSRKPGDTAETSVRRRLASGATIRLFAAKADEFAARLAEFERLLPKEPVTAKVRLGDARELAGVPDGAVDLLVSSPPYPANYDYALQHDARLRWLGLDSQGFESREIGARRHLEALTFERALARWKEDFGGALAAMSRVLSPRGIIVLVLADTVIAKKPVYAEDVMERLAPAHGLSVRAVASQARPHFHAPSARAFASRSRKEHAFLLVHGAAPFVPSAKRAR